MDFSGIIASLDALFSQISQLVAAIISYFPSLL